MQCIVTVPHDPERCTDNCIGESREFTYNSHDYIVVVPRCRMHHYSDASYTLQLSVTALEEEIDDDILTSREVRDFCRKYKEVLEKDDYEYWGKIKVAPIYSVGTIPYQLFSMRDVSLWIVDQITKEKTPVRQTAFEEMMCEICGRYVLSHTLRCVEVSKHRFNRRRKMFMMCPGCQEKEAPDYNESIKESERIRIGIFEANKVLDFLTPDHMEVLTTYDQYVKSCQANEEYRKERRRVRVAFREANATLAKMTPREKEVLLCDDQERRRRQSRGEILIIQRQLSLLKLYLKENNLEALRSLQEELKQRPISQT